MHMSFIADVQQLRRRAMEHFKQGADGRKHIADPATAAKLLNDVLTIQMACMRRYDRHRRAAKKLHAQSVAAEFAQYALEQRDHAERLAEQIIQLGGAPDYSEEGLAARSQAQLAECQDLVEMIHDDLTTERLVINTYGEIIGYLGKDRPVAKELMESLLAAEEDHSNDLASLLQEIKLQALETVQK